MYLSDAGQVKGIEGATWVAPSLDPSYGDKVALVSGIENERSMLESAGMFATGTVIQTLDTFVSALPGVDNNYIDDVTKNYWESMGNYMDENQASIGLTSDIVGAFIPGGLAIKAVRSARVAKSALTKTLGQNRLDDIMSTGMANSKLFKPVYREARNLMRTNKVNYDLDKSQEFVKLKKTMINRSVRDVLTENIAADIAVYATMYDSETMFPEDMTLVEHLLFFGGFNAAFAGAAYASAKYTMAKGLNATVARYREKNPNAGNVPNQMLSTVGNRGAALAAFQMVADGYDDVIRQMEPDSEALTAMTDAKTAAKAAMREDINLASSDSPIPGVTTSHKMSAQEIRTVQDAGDTSGASLFLGLRAFEPLVDGVDYGNKIKVKQEANRIIVSDLIDKQANATDKRKAIYAQELEDLTKANVADLKTMAVVVEIDGSISASTNRKPMFQDGERIIGSTVSGDKRLTVDKLEVAVPKSGVVMIPATVVSALKDLPEDIVQVSGKEVTASTGLTEKGLIAKLRTETGELEIPVTEKMQELRDGLPPTFRGWVSPKNPSLVSMTKTDKFSSSITLSADDVFSATSSGQLIASVKRSTALGTHNFASLTYKQITGVYDGIQAQTEAFTVASADSIALKAGMHHTQTDYIQEVLLKDIGDEVFEKMTTPYADKSALLDDLQWLSLNSKFKDFQSIQQKQADAFVADPSSVPEFYTMDDMARMLNLPLGDDRILQLFQRLRVDKRVSPLNSYFPNLAEFKNAVVDSDDLVGTDQEFAGSMLSMSRDKKPVVALTTTTEDMQGTVTREHLKEQELLSRNAALTTMANSGMVDVYGRQSFVVAEVAEFFTKRPDMLETIKKGVHSLAGGTNSTGFFTRNATTQSFQSRFQPVIQAMQQLTEMTDKAVMHKAVTEKIVAKHKQVFTEIMDRGAEGDFAAYSIVKNAMMGGWDVERKAVVSTVKGKTVVQYALKNSDRNRDLWRRLATSSWKGAPKALPDGALLPLSKLDHRPATATPLANRVLEAINDMEQQKLTEYNVLRATKNLPELTRREWHMPVPDVSSGNVVFLLSSEGHAVRAVTGSTPKEARRLAVEEAKVWEKSGTVVKVATADSIENYKFAYGDVYNELRNYARPDMQTGHGVGALSATKAVVDPKHLKADIDQIIADFVGIGRSSRQLLVEPELRVAKFQQRAAAGASSDTTTAKRKTNTEWDSFAYAASGTQRLDETSTVGKGLLFVEESYNKAMQHLYNRKYGDIAKVSKAQQKLAAKQYASMSASLPEEFMPFKSVQDYVENTAGVSLPNTLRKNAAAVNEVVAAVAIRIFDVGMAAINVLSLAVTAPVVVKALQRQSGETQSQQMQRIGAYGEATEGGIAKLSAVKTAVSAMHWMFTEEGRSFATEAKKWGLFEQFAAEQIEVFGRTGEEFVTKQLRDWTAKASWLTDKSEEFSRAISYMQFAYIGKKVIGLDDHAVAVFAHKQANNVIADFRPSNRPLVFQGAAGMPIGLFTTYMWNYLQRMYSMVETGNKSLTMMQVSLQASFFGAESLPGVPEFIDMFTSNYDGSRNLVDRMNEAYGFEETSWLLNGSVSSITGVSVGPRASVGIPGTRTNPLDANFYLEAAPATSLVKRGFDVVASTFDNIKETGEIDPAFLASAFAKSNINKGISNLIEARQGYSLDYKGNIVEEKISLDTKEGIGIWARVAGFKPLYADEFRQEYRRNAAISAKRRELKQRLAVDLRHKVVSGTLTPDNLEESLESYIRAGGQPSNFMNFFKSQAVRGANSQIDLEIVSALNASYDDGKLGRLLGIMETY